MSIITDILEVGTIAVPMGLAAWVWVEGGLPSATKRRVRKRSKAIEDDKVDGRTQQEWYELIRDIGKEETERLMVGPLDGLERDKSLAWNPEKLMGSHRWKMLQDEWYPERKLPRKVVEKATNTEWYYGRPDDLGLVEIRVTRTTNGLTARTQILFETFDDVIGVTRDFLYQKLVKTEQTVTEADRKAAEWMKRRNLEKELRAAIERTEKLVRQEAQLDRDYWKSVKKYHRL